MLFHAKSIFFSLLKFDFYPKIKILSSIVYHLLFIFIYLSISFLELRKDPPGGKLVDTGCSGC